MIELDHEIEIEASPDEVYEALVTQVGLRRWWTADSTAEPKEGSIATFGFAKRSTVFRMRVDELDPGKRSGGHAWASRRNGRIHVLLGLSRPRMELPGSTSPTQTRKVRAVLVLRATQLGEN